MLTIDAAALQAYLAACEPNYTPAAAMLACTLHSPGYHTTLPDGARVHSTREALDYALALWAAGQVERASAVTTTVLNQQDTDPANRTYGIWSWFLEEPLPRMAPPDWNWADFCGARIAVMLHAFPAVIPAPLQARMATALGHAAAAIVLRNVGPGYTNIAIMGGAVTAAAGELLGAPHLLTYGRQRLERMVAYTQEQGGFNEYNSPTYTIVAVEETERALLLVRDPATRAAATWLHRHAWEVIAAHFHPATQQWAGPHSRTYSDRLSPHVTHFLGQRLGLTIPVHPVWRTATSPAATGQPVGSPLPCPPDLLPRFHALPSDPCLLRLRFQQGASAAQCVSGTTWFSGDACLGSVTRDSLWTQRRPLLGYWRTPADPAVVLRLCFLHDGRDFAGAVLTSTQEGPQVVSQLTLEPGYGDFHLSLDKPADGIYHASDWRVRYQLLGEGVHATQSGPNQYHLSAGAWRAQIDLGPCQFLGQPLVWSLRADPSGVYLDGECYHGERRPFAFPELADVRIALTTTLQPVAAPAG